MLVFKLIHVSKRGPDYSIHTDPGLLSGLVYSVQDSPQDG